MGDDAPFRVDVKKTPKALMVDYTVNRDRGTEKAHANYRLSIELCNPEGKC